MYNRGVPYGFTKIIFQGTLGVQAQGGSVHSCKAPEPTQLKKNAVVRVAFDDTAIEGTMRWQYGKVVKVFTGGELVDINLDSGEELRATPTFDVDAVQ